MSRKTKKLRGRSVRPDSRYNSEMISAFVCKLMWDGKKSLASRLVYKALRQLGDRLDKDPREAFEMSISNVKPVVGVRSRRVGGSTYQVPVEIHPARRDALAARWIINAARARSGHSMVEKLSAEFVDAFNSTGAAFKKKEEMHRMAEANRAFSHYHW